MNNITTHFIGVQRGNAAWDLPDFDLYNIDAPALRCHGTTIAVPAGSPPAAVQTKATETAEAWA